MRRPARVWYHGGMSTLAKKPPAVFYPSWDGERMAENTLQFEWIVTIQGNLDLLFRDDPNVFVAGDHLIYPIDGDADTRQAPDVYVAFGRPKGHRGSYKVFAEGGVFPQVVFEVWSPGNTADRMEEKRQFYATYGAEEYYVLFPDFPAYWHGWRREGGDLVRVPEMNGFVSPRLGVRFESAGGKVAAYLPNGERFLSYVERGVRGEENRKRADAERLKAERLKAERLKAERLAARLRELGIDPDTV